MKKQPVPLTKEAQLSELLIKIGIPVHLNGYTYLHAAILRYIELTPKYTKVKVTRYVYPWVAEQQDTTSVCVERSIRTVIRKAFTHGNLPLLNRIFGLPENSTTTKVIPNTHFIAMLAFRISQPSGIELLY